MHAPRKLHSWRHLMLTGGVAATCGALIVAGVVWERFAARESTTEPAPTFVVVGTQSQDWAQSATATFSLTKPATLTAPVGGVVTALLTDGTGLATNGVPVMSVDGTTIRAVTGGTPLFRSLSTGDHGDDVASLSRLLQDLKYLPAGPPTKGYTEAVAAAVRQYQQEAHVPVTGAFDPASVVYVPDMATVVSWDVQVGQRIEPGTPIAETVGAATSVHFSTDNKDGLAHLRSGQLTLRAGGSTVDLRSLQPSGAELAALNQGLRDLSAAGKITSDGPSADGDAPAEVFRDLRLALATPVRRGTIPVTALDASRSGAQCVYVRGRSDVISARRVEADAAPTNTGVAYVTADLAGASVVRDVSTAPRAERSKCR